MRVRLALVALLALGCARPPPTVPARAATYRVHDLTPTFWRFWDRAHALPEAEQVRRFEAEVVAAHPEVYTAEVMGLPADVPLHDALVDRWPKFLRFAGAQLPLARELSSSLGRELPRFDARFRETFPDFAYDGDVYFLASIGGFDGGTRAVNGRMALLFGVDLIAAVYGADAELASFFHHELFHVYHRQFPDPELEGTVARALWVEGLAVYVAERLNPGTSEAMLLGLPRSSPARVRAELPRLAAELRGRLDSREREDYARYFLGSEEGRDPPARAGYTLGYLVVKEVAGDRSLPELARLRGPELRRELDAALARLAAR